MFKKPFSFQGRIGRLEFFLSLLILIAYVLIIIFISNYLKPVDETYTGYLSIFFFPPLWFFLVVRIKRLHDLDQSAWLLLLSAVPVVNIALELYMLFGSGYKRANKYGSGSK
jgi:uncharacterized membrane protein YhaH (DUF805 family)